MLEPMPEPKVHIRRKPFIFVPGPDHFGRENKLWLLTNDGETYQLFEFGKSADYAKEGDLLFYDGVFMTWEQVNWCVAVALPKKDG